jgi:UDP-N-acetylmuramate: L-alanyl-gamma-D-glutamyl-meso-diaminopimelate ligase
VPESSTHFYMIAIGGTGMAPLACLLKEAGHRVCGVDGPLYPPMSDLLAAAGIEPLVGYEPGHLLASDEKPDLVIVGNAVPRDNPEVLAAEQLALPRLSMPQALARFFLGGRRPLVVAGTHGKTTTTALAAWVWRECGADPGYLVGGVPCDLERSFNIGSGERFIVEGDEYNASYFDRGPKFLHYQPRTLILTSVEYDHADLYPDHETLLAAYRRLVRLVPDDGLIVACGDGDGVREIAREASCRVVFYGLEEGNDVRPVDLEPRPRGARRRRRFRSSFTVDDAEAGPVELEIRLPGGHNLANALAVWAAGRAEGLDLEELRRALASFRGVKRRLEELGAAAGVTVVDDFAHHPTAVEESLGGLRQRYGKRPLLALFEPRSLTAGRAHFFDAYVRAFAGADAVLFAPVYHRERLAPEDKLDLDRLAKSLREAGVDSAAAADVDDLLELALARARPRTVVVTMSSGSFAGLPHRLLARLRESA